MTRYRTAVTTTIFIIAVVGCGLAFGLMNIPDGWYAGLRKPWFNPPNWIFAPAWTTLYVLIAIAGSRVWLADHSSLPMAIWLLQMVLNFARSPVFFGGHMIGAASVVILALLAVILLFIWKVWNTDRIAALLFLPYAAWVIFATTLNAAILMLN